jgi:hypothetical protein
MYTVYLLYPVFVPDISAQTDVGWFFFKESLMYYTYTYMSFNRKISKGALRNTNTAIANMLNNSGHNVLY